MKIRRLLPSVSVVISLSICEAKRVTLASTVTAYGRGGASTASDRSILFSDINEVTASTKSKGKGRSLSLPKLWGQRSAKGESESDGETTAPSAAGVTDGSSDDTESTGGGGGKEEDAVKDETPQQSSNGKDIEAESLEKEGSPKPQSTDADGTEHDPSEPQPTNQTRPGVLYMNIPSHASPMMPHHQHARPMPYPYMPQQQPPPNRSPSLLSSILSVFLPRPQNMPPSPYGPPMPPSSPMGPGGNHAILSLVIRLAIISLGTYIVDLLGLGSHSDAFLPTPAQHYTFERVNDRYRKDGSALRQALSSPPPGVRKQRWKRAFRRRGRDAVSTLILSEDRALSADGSVAELPSLDNGALYNRTVIIVEMKPDSRVGNGVAEQLRDTVSFLLESHRDHVDKRSHANHRGPSKLRLPSKLIPRYFSSSSRNHRTPTGMRTALGNELEVVLFLDSPGGTVQDYGLASSHLSRLRDEPQVTLSVCVDRVAASGGYMMACQATPGHLHAAPFAMLGSIGVLMETVNFHEVLKQYGVKPLVIKAGKNKAPLKTLGEVSDEELQMAQDDADVIHVAFQEWVTKSRPNVVASSDWVEKVCTGSVFLGSEARELGLVDRVCTSDEYVAERIAAGDRVLRLIPYRGPQFGLRLSPLDLLLSGMDAEGRARLIGRARGLGEGVMKCVAPLFRVGATVGVLNHLASLPTGNPGYSWEA